MFQNKVIEKILRTITGLFGKKYKLQTSEQFFDKNKNREFEIWYLERFTFYEFYIKFNGEFSSVLLHSVYVDAFFFELENGTFDIEGILNRLEREYE